MNQTIEKILNKHLSGGYGAFRALHEEIMQAIEGKYTKTNPENNYYYVSEDVVKSFPDLEKSKPFKRHGNKLGYVAVVPDFDLLIEHYNSNPGDGEYHFAYHCMDSQVDLKYIDVIYDEEDLETEVESKLTLAICQDLGLVAAIEDCLGLTEEKNVAFVIYKLAEDNKLNPIELINKL